MVRTRARDYNPIRSSVKNKWWNAIGTAAGTAASALAAELFSGKRNPGIGISPTINISRSRKNRRVIGGRLAGKYLGRRPPMRKARTRRGRRGRRVLRKTYKMAFRGLEYKREGVQAIQDDNCVYIGHHSTPIDPFFRYTVYTIMKKLLNKKGIDVSDLNIQQGEQLKAGDTISFRYIQRPGLTPITITVNINIANTYLQLFDSMVNSLYSEMNNGILGYSSKILDINYNTTGDRVILVLVDASVSILTKSSLKMQNRSVAVAADNEADDVNNVPLSGKIYGGTGNALVFRSTWENPALVGNDTTGQMVRGAGATDQLKEPPQGYSFHNCNTVGKVRLQPGDIKTSVLTYRKTFKLDTAFGIFSLNYVYNSDTNAVAKIGSFRVFGLEQVIAKTIDESGVNVKWEIDFHQWIDVKTRASNYTVARVSV